MENIHALKHARGMADSLLENSEYTTEHLVELADKGKLGALNSVKHGDVSVPYARFGQPNAMFEILETGPYLTDIASPHYRLRIAAQQEALGDNYAITAVQAFAPKDEDLTPAERLKVGLGDFSPLSERVLRVAEHLKIYKAHAYGQSMGADVSTQLTYDTLNDPNKGVLKVEALGALEPARVKDRGAVKVALAMNGSGKQLYENVIGSKSVPLLDAWNIEYTQNDDGVHVPASERKKFWKQVKSGGAEYLKGSIKGNWALTKGFGTDETARQLYDIIVDGKTFVMVGRQALSKVCTPKFMKNLEQKHDYRDEVSLYTDEGDHSDDDNIRRSAGRILHFAIQARQSLNRRSGRSTQF